MRATVREEMYKRQQYPGVFEMLSELKQSPVPISSLTPCIKFANCQIYQVNSFKFSISFDQQLCGTPQSSSSALLSSHPLSPGVEPASYPREMYQSPTISFSALQLSTAAILFVQPRAQTRPVIPSRIGLWERMGTFKSTVFRAIFSRLDCIQSTRRTATSMHGSQNQRKIRTLWHWHLRATVPTQRHSVRWAFRSWGCDWFWVIERRDYSALSSSTM